MRPMKYDNNFSCYFIFFNSAKSRCTLVLTYLDYYDMEPILLNDNVIPRSMLIYKCPDQLKISEHYPPMSGIIFKSGSKVISLAKVLKGKPGNISPQ